MVQLTLDMTVHDKIRPKTMAHPIWFYHPQCIAGVSSSNMASSIADITFMFHNRKE